MSRVVEDLRWCRRPVGQLGQRDLPQRMETCQLALPKAGTLGLELSLRETCPQAIQKGGVHPSTESASGRC